MGGPVGMHFHGTAIAYLEHNARFLAPVRPGDTLTIALDDRQAHPEARARRRHRRARPAAPRISRAWSPRRRPARSWCSRAAPRARRRDPSGGEAGGGPHALGDQRRSAVDESRVDLHQRGAGRDLLARVLAALDAADADDRQRARPVRRASTRTTAVARARSGAPDRPPASLACGSPATASRAIVVLVAITASTFLRERAAARCRAARRRPGRARS